MKTISPAYKLDWMIRRDMPEVLQIERASFEFPWTEEDFVRCLRQRNCIGMAVKNTQTDAVEGFMIYELHHNRLHILNIAVRWPGRGIGRRMIEKLISKLSTRRTKIMCEVRETNLEACLFFKAMGFRCISVLKDFYEDTAEDAYLMRYRWKGGEA